MAAQPTWRYLVLGLSLALPCPLAAQEDEVIPDTVRETPVVRAVRRVTDSVVSIRTTVKANPYIPFPARGQEMVRGQGSGVILDRDGLVITNYHVVSGLENQPAATILVTTFEPREEFRAEIVTYDQAADLAVLRIKTEKAGTFFRPIPLGTSADLMIGETVIAIGNPVGQEHTVTTGVLSARGREIQVRGPDGRLLTFRNLLQTDAAINPGNSGGALVNLTGKLIGINNAIRAESEGIGYAIPVDTVIQVLDSLLTLDKAGNFWLGMRLDQQGEELRVTTVVPEGPAWRSGLREGDLVRAVGDRNTPDSKQFTVAFLGQIQEGKVPLLVQRDGRSLRLTLEASSKVNGFLFEHLGLEAEEAPLTRPQAELLVRAAEVQVRSLSTVRIRRVIPGGPADQAGLKAGDLVVAFAATDRFGDPVEVHLAGPERLAQSLYGRNVGSQYGFMILRGEELYRGNLKLR